MHWLARLLSLAHRLTKPQRASRFSTLEFRSDDEMLPGIGDLVWTDFDPTKRMEQAGRRPALVVSSVAFTKNTGLAIVRSRRAFGHFRPVSAARHSSRRLPRKSSSRVKCGTARRMTMSPSCVAISTRSPSLRPAAFTTSPGNRMARFFPQFPRYHSHQIYEEL